MEEGLDTFVVVDGLPVVPAESKQKLIKFLLKKLNTVGHTSEDAIFMPLNEKNMSEGYVLLPEYDGISIFLGSQTLDLRSLNMIPPNRPWPQ